MRLGVGSDRQTQRVNRGIGTGDWEVGADDRADRMRHGEEASGCIISFHATKVLPLKAKPPDITYSWARFASSAAREPPAVWSILQRKDSK